MNKVMYEVWGEDTFARESYLVGTFETREKAGKALEASEKSVLDQCEELRDTYWIVELTPEREKRGRNGSVIRKNSVEVKAILTTHIFVNLYPG